MVYDLSTTATAKEIVPNEKLKFEWDSEEPTTVEMDFKTLSDGSTFVSVVHYGFSKTGDELVEAIKDSKLGKNVNGKMNKRSTRNFSKKMQ